MRILFICFFAIAHAAGVCAQDVLENNPPSVKWFEVTTPNFRILFPRGFEKQAQRVANSFEHIREAEAGSLGGSLPRKIAVILQNQSSVSNGFVSVLPRRSELYAMPSQDYNFVGINDWMNLLVSHEYRHIVQYRHARRGFNNLLYVLFGAPTFAGMAQAAAPGWFWEGDAVSTETAFTPGGRGKIPNFGLAFKTNLLEGREFNYHKQHLRSYRHFIPDEYVLGYYMTSYLRKRTNDPDIWGKITARSWSVPFIPFAFSNAIKKETGLYVTDLYKEMARDFRDTWKKEMEGMEITPFETVNVRKNNAYTDYLYPQVLEDGSVLAMKAGIGDIQQFVLLKDGAERRVFTPGFVNDAGMLSAAGSKVVWNEYGFDPRWTVRTWSLVKGYDFVKKDKTVIGPRKGRFGSAALSPDGTRVAAVRTGTDYETRLVILDYASGEVVREYANEANDFYSMPRWSADGRSICALKTNAGGRTITVFDADGEARRDVMGPSAENAGHPLLIGDYLLFNSPVNGIDNIYALNISSGERFQITSSRYGAYNPCVSHDGRTLYYNDQTRNGLDIVRIPFDPPRWKPYVADPDPVQFYSHLVEQEGDLKLFQTVPSTNYPVKKYSRLKGLINPYTWGLNVDSDLTEATIGVVSRDILSTTSVSLGYVFDINERTGAWKADISYQGLFPIVDLSASIANRSVYQGEYQYERLISDDTISFRDDLTFEWQEKNIEAGLRVPLITTNGKYSSNVTVGNAVGVTAVSGFANSINTGGRVLPSVYPFRRLFLNYQDNGDLIYNRFSLDAYRLLKRSVRDINSKWGQRIFVDVSHTPFGGDYSGMNASVYALAYFPGLFRHHSLWGYGAFQRTKFDYFFVPEDYHSNVYIFRNHIPLPRGQRVFRDQDMYTASANYTLPLWYPDIALGPVVNFKRIRANAFFDYGYGISQMIPIDHTYMSAGVELKLDLNIMRFYPEFDIGVRFTKGISPSTTDVEVLIGTFNF